MILRAGRLWIACSRRNYGLGWGGYSLSLRDVRCWRAYFSERHRIKCWHYTLRDWRLMVRWS